MKKIIVGTLGLLILVGLGCSKSVVAESLTVQNGEEVYQATNSTKALTAFSDMQDKITAVLSVKNGKYVYDENEVKNIVDTFDFEKLKNDTGIEFTKESFYKVAISNIENTVLKTSIAPRQANKYNRNANESGWNYVRSWMDTKKAKVGIKNANDAADMLNGGAALSSLGGVFASGPFASIFGIISGFGGITGLYFSNMASNMEYKNNATNTGIVVDWNRFTFQYDVWTQKEY